MTNLERYKDEFVYMLNDNAYQPPLCNYFEKIWTYSDCSCCPFCTKDETVCDYQKFVDWLLEEHKEPIKLKQWEKDFIVSCTECRAYEIKDTVANYWPIKNMIKKGYFKGIKDEDMKLFEILDNCEVVD